MNHRPLLVPVWLATAVCQAEEVPAAPTRIITVEYDARAVTTIPVERGTVTRVVLDPTEKIARNGAATGFPADCSRPGLEWCIRAEPGGSQVLVKPLEGATSNNLELRTDRRDYSLRFETAQTGKASPGQKAAYRVVFHYPPAGAAPQPASLDVKRATPQETLRAVRPTPTNWRYTVQVLEGAQDITPSLVFDDHRFTYFQFAGGREFPAIFQVSASGEESRVNFHVEDSQPDMLVVERLGRRFVLRLGRATVGVWNEAYDPEATAGGAGTVTDAVVRKVRKEKQP